MLRELIAVYGLPLVFANVLLESLGLPLPALPTLILTGAIATVTGVAAGADIGMNVLRLAEIVLVGTAAALLGDTLWFGLGRRYGNRVLMFMCKMSISRDICVSRSGDFFARYGVRVLTLSKFIPGLSTLAIPVAGASGVTLRSFLLFDALGTVLWAGFGVVIGAFFAGAIDTLLQYLDWLGEGALAVAVAALACYIGVKWWRRVALLRQLRMQRIDVAQLSALLASNDPPIVVDARRDRHRALIPFVIPGATVLRGKHAGAQLNELERHRKLVVYCDCPNEMSAALVAKRMVDHGFNDVAPLAGGMEAWRAAGYALEPLLLDAAMKESVRAITKSTEGDR